MMGLAIAAANFFYIPGFIIRRLKLSKSLKFYLMPAGNFLDYMNSLINPFIYSWQSKDFYNSYRETAQCESYNTVVSVGKTND